MITAAIWLTALIVAGAAVIFPWWVLAIGFALGVAVVLRAWWWAHTWAERN